MFVQQIETIVLFIIKILHFLITFQYESIMKIIIKQTFKNLVVRPIQHLFKNEKTIQGQQFQKLQRRFQESKTIYVWDFSPAGHCLHNSAWMTTKGRHYRLVNSQSSKK